MVATGPRMEQEQRMDIQLGKPVISKDGEQIGKVDQIVVDPDSRAMLEIIIHKGLLLPTDRIVETRFIAGTDADGTIQLTITAARAKGLPRFFETEYVVPPPHAEHTLPYPIEGAVNAGGLTSSPFLWRSGYSGKGYEPVSHSFFEPAAVESAATSVRTSLADDSVSLTKGTDVVGMDGRKIGTVADVIYGANRQIEAIVAAAGLRHEHRLEIAAVDVQAMTPSEVRLAITADEAIQRAKTASTAAMS
jgi:uncharacterized protein YrrD